jgi:hypothetical protein
MSTRESKRAPFRYILLASVLILVPFFLSRQRPEAKAANRIREQYLAAETWILARGNNPRWEDVDEFLGKLKSIDVTGAPADVERAFLLFTAAVEANVRWRTLGVNVTESNEHVAERKREFVRALDRWRGEPF